MRIAGIEYESIVDGPGIRLVYFLQGCKHNCAECHNPQTHDFSGGAELTLEQLEAIYDIQPLCDGVTFSGGDPMEQAEELLMLVKWFAEKKVHMILYTGYKWEELMQSKRTAQREILRYVDWVIDGRYEKEHRNLSLRFRGSANQRVICAKESMRDGKLILADV